MAATGWLRLVRPAAMLVVAASVASTVGSCALTPGQDQAGFCALMPDSIGLYAGNPVTQMGYRIGTVKAITPGANNVRVDFTVTDSRRLPRDVKAVIRSTSVLADRSLEVVGNPEAGPWLQAGDCIPLERSFTPKSLSQMIGSATTFVNSINPDGSTNVADAVRGIDQAMHGNGAGINRLLTTTSSVLDSPDQTINDMGSVVTNLSQMTSLLVEQRGPLKQILLDAQQTMPAVLKASTTAPAILGSTVALIKAVADIEVNVGDTLQGTLDAVSMALRKAAAHAPAIADLLTPIPWWVNTIANHYNNRTWNLLQYRPPLYRIRTPDGVALCNIMNATTPNSCANVQGQPYAVDVALLQYVLTQASR